MKILSGIYAIQNISNKKMYIGRSKNIYKEWRDLHLSRLRKNIHANSYLQSSWNKYGENNFKHFILEECSEDLLNQKEIEYIKKYDTNNRSFGYNLTNGGGGISGYKYSEEERIKRSYRFSGKNNPFYSKKHSQESIEQMRKYHIENPISKESQTKGAISRIGNKNAIGALGNRGIKRKKK